MEVPHSSRGCAFGDFDNDGDVDILVVNVNEPPSLLRNDVTGDHHWLKVKLEGVKSNRSAIGARVTARYGRRIQAQEVLTQSSYLSVNDRRLHFGLGDSTKADIEVRWPSGRFRETHRHRGRPADLHQRRIRDRRSAGLEESVSLGLALSAVLVVSTGMFFAQKPAPNPAIDQAWDLVAHDKRPEAIALLRGEISKHPQNADTRLLLGSLLSESGEAAEGIVHLREGVRLRPRSAIARNALGEALNDVGDVPAARAEFETAAALDPKLAPARENLGLVLLQNQDLAGASKQLDRAIELYGRKVAGAYAKYLRARVHTASGELKEAETELQSAVALRPDLAEAWSDLGQVRYELDDEKGALAALHRSPQVNPSGAVAQTRLGSLSLRLGRPTDAVPHLERAVQLMPDDQTALNSLQRALREAGQPEKADQVKSRLAELIRKRDRDSQNALTAVNLNNEGSELQKQGKLAEAAEKYRAAVELNPRARGDARELCDSSSSAGSVGTRPGRTAHGSATGPVESDVPKSTGGRTCSGSDGIPGPR